MPLKQPPRDLSKVKCVKKSKDKNGEEVIEYQVLFDFVSNHRRKIGDQRTVELCSRKLQSGT